MVLHVSVGAHAAEPLVLPAEALVLHAEALALHAEALVLQQNFPKLEKTLKTGKF